MLGAPFAFHTCFHAIDIVLDGVMRELLLEAPEEDDRQPSTFDAWVHAQFLNRKLNAL